jgi:hypothetical protein
MVERRLELRAAGGIDGEADVLHVLAVFLRGHHHLVEGGGARVGTRIVGRRPGGGGCEERGQRQADPFGG